MKKRQSLIQRLENPSSPSGRVDVLTYGVLSRLVNSQEERMGIPQGTALEMVKPHIASFANNLNTEVRKLGISPELVGLGMLIGVNLYQKFKQASQTGALPVPSSENGVAGAQQFPTDSAPPPPNAPPPSVEANGANNRMPPKNATVVGRVPVIGYGRGGRTGRM
jgi:hypothetical protein